ncbi:hypothetical protein [Prevotella sp. KH2C16]|uniref:hypothetical protein n=1 Tax=Prevotella sp. KH2C16 TaxID=1855325 RepID=UPI000B805940|nr:hypothetical protein [Prevotella sp. KH2C16]
MKKVQKILQLEFWIPIVVSLLLVVLFETDILETGLLSEDKGSEFVMTSVMELATICFIPLALYLFRFKKIHDQLCSEKGERYLQKWGTCRLALLYVPMVLNTLLYYLFMHVAFAYLAIILLLSLCFVYPSSERCLDETDGRNS